MENDEAVSAGWCSCLNLWRDLSGDAECLVFASVLAAHKLNVMLSPPTLPILGKFSFHCLYIAFWCLVCSRTFHWRFFRSKEPVCNKEAFSKFPLKFLLQRILSSSFRITYYWWYGNNHPSRSFLWNYFALSFKYT